MFRFDSKKMQDGCKAVAEFLASVRSIALSAFALMMLVLLASGVVSEWKRHVVLVEPFTVSPEFERLGYGPGVVASHVVDKVKAIQRDVRAEKRGREFVTPISEPTADVEVPDTHISIRSIVSYAKEYWGSGVLRVGGDVVLASNKVCITVRVVGKEMDPLLPSSSSVTGPVERLDDLFHQAAEEALRYTDPYFLAAYYLTEERTANALPVIPLCYRKKGAHDKASAYFLWAIADIQRTNSAGAVTNLLASLELDPHWDAPYIELSGVAMVQGDFSNATRYCWEAIYENPKGAVGFANLGIIEILQTNVEKSLEMTRRAISLNPTDADEFRNLAYTYLVGSNYGEAVEACEQGIRLEPNSGDLYNLLGSVYAEESNYAKAETTFIQGLQVLAAKNGEDTETGKWLNSQMFHYRGSGVRFGGLNTRCALLLNVGLMVWAQDRPEEAKGFFKSAVGCDPKDAEIHWRVGRAYVACEDYGTAAQELKDAVRADPQFWEAYSDLGYALVKLTNYAEACVNFDKATRLNPNDVETWADWGDALRYMGRDEEQLDKWERASALEPTNAVYLLNAGDVLRRQGDYGRAMDYFQRAEHMDQSVPNAYLGMGLCYDAAEDPEDAVEMFRRSTEIDPCFTMGYVAWAAELSILGDEIAATEKYLEALRISPHLEEHSVGEISGYLARREQIP